jgi:uncharacterized protein YbjT (DUF2867 family)
VSTPTAFVAGATGYTGREVVAELRRRGIATVAHVRPGSSDLATWRARFTTLGATVDVTPWEPDLIAATIARVRPDFIFAMLGTTRHRAAREGLDDPYERVDYGLTAQLRRGAIEAGAGTRFVYLSSLGANERSGSKYLAVRGRMERELAEGSLPYLIAQPALISGEDREEARREERVLARITDGLLGGLAMIGIRGPRDHYGTLTGAQLALAMVELALRDRNGRATVQVGALREAAGLH